MSTPQPFNVAPSPLFVPSGYDPALLTPEEAELLKGTTPGVDLIEYQKRHSGGVRWVVDGLVPVGGMATIYGPPKRARKSYLAIQMARDIALGQSFLGQFNVPEKGTVLFVQLDTPQSLWQERYEKLEAAGVEFSDEVKSRLITVDTTDIFPLEIGTPKGQAYIRYHIRKFNPVLVIFDVMRKLYKGSEDASDSTDQVMSDMKVACAPAAVLFITHAKKPKEKGDSGTMSELRGSSNIGGSCDTVMRIRPETKRRKHTLMCVEGRAVATVDYPMKSLGSNFYAIIDDSWSQMVRKFGELYLAETYESVSEAGRALKADADLIFTGKDAKSLDACRMAITRYKEAQEEL